MLPPLENGEESRIVIYLPSPWKNTTTPKVFFEGVLGKFCGQTFREYYGLDQINHLILLPSISEPLSAHMYCDPP